MRLGFLVLAVCLLSLIQAFNFSIIGVKPDLALVAVVSASFFVADVWQGLFLAALASLVLKFSPGFEKEILFFSVTAAASVVLGKYLPARHFIGNVFLIAAATFVLYLLAAADLIVSFVFLKELFLNVIFGILMFETFSFLWQDVIRK
ncbi:hypothetical protein HZB06_02045 [Candidatus Wolfebacteria bacterium]|nr:hypothetical protein [Candidatus Wolfebacteria bacterium]